MASAGRLPMVDDAGAQVARLDCYVAWARAELERLTGAGEHPERQTVLRENLDGARVVLERILAKRAVGQVWLKRRGRTEAYPG
jgi:hypothetical protein